MSLSFLRNAALLASFLFVPMLMPAQHDPQPPARPPVAPPAQLPPTCVQSSNTWCPVATAPTTLGTMLLLTDGRVMAQTNTGLGCGSTWNILTPDSTGNYANGTWTTTAAMSTPRLYFASTVMQNGQVWVLGGEYTGSGCGESLSHTGEIYDPVANAWTAISNYPNTDFGDDPSELLSGGRIIAGDIFTNTPQIWTPTPTTVTPGTWAAAASKVYNDRSDEEGWAKLPNGDIIVYDLFQSINDSTGRAEVYIPATSGAGAWSNASPGFNGITGTLPVLTNSTSLGSEMGPILRLQDGRIFQIGANQHTALFNPTDGAPINGTPALAWAAGPDILGPATGGCSGNCAYGADDAPAAELPTGHVVFMADAGPTNGIFQPPAYMFDFDPVPGTISLLSSQPPPLTLGNSISSFYTRQLMLPNGQMLWNDGDSTMYVYTPSSTVAAPPYRPAVSNVTYTGTTKLFLLTGTQLNGPSAGSYYGDDVVTDENYPIVRLVSSTGTVYYAKTTNWSSVAVGNVGSETVNFLLPASLNTPGNYTLIVSGAGVQGTPLAIHITGGEIGIGGVSGGAQ